MGVMTFVVTKRSDIRCCQYVCVMTKRAVIQLRVSEGEKAVWVESAGRLGLSLSDWVRRRCNELSMEDVELDVDRVMDGVARKFDDPLLPGGPARKSVEAQAMERLERVRAPRPSAVQVAKRSYDPDFK